MQSWIHTFLPCVPKIMSGILCGCGMLWKKIQFFIIGQCLLHSQSDWWLPWMISVTEKSSPIHRNQDIHNFAVCLVPTRGLINHIVNNHNKMAATRNVRKFTLPSFKNVLSLDSGSLLPWVLQLPKHMYGLNTLDNRFLVSTRFSSSSGNRNRRPRAIHTRHLKHCFLQWSKSRRHLESIV